MNITLPILIVLFIIAVLLLLLNDQIRRMKKDNDELWFELGKNIGMLLGGHKELNKKIDRQNDTLTKLGKVYVDMDFLLRDKFPYLIVNLEEINRNISSLKSLILTKKINKKK